MQYGATASLVFYVLQPNAKEPSRLEILRQYENAIKKIGGNVLVHNYDGSSYMKLTQGGKEIWVHVDAYISSQYNLWIIEKAGIASARLKAFGVGPLAPVASNDTPDGKAMNRRVELVKL